MASFVEAGAAAIETSGVSMAAAAEAAACEVAPAPDSVAHSAAVALAAPATVAHASTVAHLDLPDLDELGSDSSSAAAALEEWLLSMRERMASDAKQYAMATELASRLHLGGAREGSKDHTGLVADERGVTVDETARVLEGFAVGETPLHLPSRQLSPKDPGLAAEHLPRNEALDARVPRASEPRASEYKQAGVGQLIFSAAPRPVPPSDVPRPLHKGGASPARRKPTRAAWMATGSPPPRSPSRDFRRLPSPEQVADARPGRGEPRADTHQGRTAQQKEQWEARERQPGKAKGTPSPEERVRIDGRPAEMWRMMASMNCICLRYQVKAIQGMIPLLAVKRGRTNICY